MLPMLQQLETFCVVAEAGSLSKAAERLHLTQPAITRQVRALERDVGALLLTRSPTGVVLTPVGQEVLVHARAAVAAVRAARQAARGTTQQAGRLSIAAGMMAMQYVLPPVVARFRAAHPQVEVDLQPTHQRVAVERLLRYEVDVAVLSSPVRSAQVRSIALRRDPLLFVTSPDVGSSRKDERGGRGQAPALRESDAASEAKSIDLADLDGRTLLVLPQGTGLHEQVVAALRRPAPGCRLLEYPTAETIKTAVALGVAATILPASAVQAEIEAGTLVARRIADWPDAERVIRVLLRAEGKPPAVVEEFVALLRRGG
jgi:DNA-binding transcriptional LysR family regulator